VLGKVPDQLHGRNCAHAVVLKLVTIELEHTVAPGAVLTLSKCADNSIAPVVPFVPGILTRTFNPSKYVTVILSPSESRVIRSFRSSSTIDERSSSTTISSYSAATNVNLA
jgi:hypothetical protein